MSAKTKSIAVASAVVVVACVIAALVKPGPRPGPQEAPGPVRQTPVSQRTASRQIPPDLPPTTLGPPQRTDALEKIAADFAANPKPVWGVEIGPLVPGQYSYSFHLDGQSIADPLNRPPAPGEPNSSFVWPPKDRATSTTSAARASSAGLSTSLRPISPTSAVFLYEGRIARALLFIAPFRGEWWGVDEFQPLNAAARANLDTLLTSAALGAIHGSVLDPQRRPIAHARVRFHDPRKGGEGYYMGRAFLRTVACDERGRFRAERLPRADATVVGRARGFAESPVRSVAISFSSPSAPCEIILSPTTLVGGFVSNETGRAVAEATVIALPAEMRSSLRSGKTTTDAAGRYLFETLGPGEYSFLAEASGYAVALRPGVHVASADDQPSSSVVNLMLRAGTVLSGRVVRRVKRGGDETGVEGAEITFTGNMTDAGGAPFPGVPSTVRATSGRDGSFAAALSPNCLYFCTARWKTLSSLERPTVSVPPGKTATSLTLHLPPVGQLTGRVLDPDKKPVAGAQVENVTASNFRRQWSRRDTPVESVTDAAGRFTFDELDLEARCNVRVRAEGFAPQQAIGLAVDSLTEPEIILKRGAVLSGRVVEAGSEKPLENFQTTLSGAGGYGQGSSPETFTDANGAFAFRTVAPGTYEVVARGIANGKTYGARSPGRLVVKEGEPPKELLLEAYPVATLRGTVLEAESRKPVAEASVNVRSSRSGSSRNATSDPNGVFLVADLEPGAKSISANKEGFETATVDVDIAPGETREGVEVLLPPGRAVIAVVSDPGGKPVSGAIVNFQYLSKKADADGRAVFTNLPVDGRPDAPRARLFAYTQSEPWLAGESEPVTLPDDKRSVEVPIRLGPAAGVSGTVKDTQGAPVSFVTLSASSVEQNPYHTSLARRSDSSGRYAIRGLPPGAYRLGVVGDERYVGQSREVRLKAGEITDGVDFVVTEQTSGRWLIRGLLVDLRGRPMANFQVFVRPESGQRVGSSGQQTTGHDGSFTVTDLEKGSYNLFVSSGSGSWQRSGVAAVEADSDEARQAQIFVLPTGGALRGRLVFGESGRPVPRAEVSLQSRYDARPPAPAKKGEWQFNGSIYSNVSVSEKDDGRFTIEPLPFGDYQLNIRSPMALPVNPVRATVNLSLETDLGNLELQGAHFLAAQLIDARTRQPYVNGNGFSISAVAECAARGSVQLIGFRDGGFIAETDPKGRIRWGGAPDDTISVKIMTEEHLPAMVSPIQINPSGETDLGAVYLDPGHTITGRVVDARTGKPLTAWPPGYGLGVMGKLTSGQPAMNLLAYDRARGRSVDPQGRFTIRRVPPDLAELTFQTQLYLPRTIAPIQLSPTGVTDLGDVALTRGQTVRGKLLGPKGERVDYASLTISAERPERYERSANANAGEFAVPNLPPGTARLTASGQVSGQPRRSEIRDHLFTILPDQDTFLELHFPPIEPQKPPAPPGSSAFPVRP